MLLLAQRFFAGRPVVRVVALFTALNLITVLVFTLFVPPSPISIPSLPVTLPIQDPAQSAWRVGMAIALYALVLYYIRPGRRRPWELAFLSLVGFGVVYWLSTRYLPFLALGLVPIVARVWMPLWSVLVIVGGLIGLSAWWSIRQGLQIYFTVSLDQGPVSTAWRAIQVPIVIPNLETSFFVFIAFLFAGYSLFTLEMLLRETKAREELEHTRRELEQTSRQAGVLEERQRLTREIHDTLAQGFASIVVQLEAAEAASQNETTGLRHLEQARASARDGLSEARRMMWALRPEILEDNSIPEALGRFLQRWQEESGVQAQFTLTGEPSLLHPEAEVGLLRVVQEALSNVRKHSRAKRVSVTLSYLDDLVLLDIQDDGIGLQITAQSGSFGLRSMRERVEALGGQMTVESELGQGTTLAVSLPLSYDPKPSLEPTDTLNG